MVGRKKRWIVRHYTNIGRRIAEKGGAQKVIAPLLGVSQQTVSKKLRGEVVITVRDLERLAKAFGVDVRWFFEGYRGSALEVAD